MSAEKEFFFILDDKERTADQGQSKVLWRPEFAVGSRGIHHAVLQ
jgi:hypothetical protein